MKNDFSEIWQSQTTSGARISLEEVRKRVQRSTARENRAKAIAVTAAVGNILVMIVHDVFFFESPFRVWFSAVQLVLWVVFCRYLGRSVVPDPGRVLTLNLRGRSTPCLNFYRQQLQSYRNSLRQGRGVTFMAGIAGIFLLVVSSIKPHFGKHPEVFMPLGLVLSIGGFLWYLLLRREYPRVQAELNELEAHSESASVAER